MAMFIGLTVMTLEWLSEREEERLFSFSVPVFTLCQRKINVAPCIMHQSFHVQLPAANGLITNAIPSSAFSPPTPTSTSRLALGETRHPHIPTASCSPVLTLTSSLHPVSPVTHSSCIDCVSYSKPSACPRIYSAIELVRLSLESTVKKKL